MPPPGEPEVPPLATVRSAILTEGLPASPKTRLAWLPLTVRLLRPGPLMVKLSVMSSSPLVRVMVPVVAKVITSAPGLALAALTAARSEPVPVSRRLVTVKVLGSARSSRASGCGRIRFAGADRSARRLFRVVVWRWQKDCRFRSQHVNDMVSSPFPDWSAIEWRDIVPGAQTERRGRAGEGLAWR